MTAKTSIPNIHFFFENYISYDACLLYKYSVVFMKLYKEGKIRERMGKNEIICHFKLHKIDNKQNS